MRTLALLLILATTARAAPPSPPERPRLVVLTDISSLTAGVAEPDDGQSLIRLMLYTNEFDIEGLVAKGELLIVAVVAAGESGTAGLYYASIPDTQPELVQPARDALADLQVDG